MPVCASRPATKSANVSAIHSSASIFEARFWRFCTSPKKLFFLFSKSDIKICMKSLVINGIFGRIFRKGDELVFVHSKGFVAVFCGNILINFVPISSLRKYRCTRACASFCAEVRSGLAGFFHDTFQYSFSDSVCTTTFDIWFERTHFLFSESVEDFGVFFTHCGFEWVVDFSEKFVAYNHENLYVTFYLCSFHTFDFSTKNIASGLRFHFIMQ